MFDKMFERDVVSWTPKIDGRVDSDKPIKAIALFAHMVEIDIKFMVEIDIKFNEATVVLVLRACADTGALSIGKKCMIY